MKCICFGIKWRDDEDKEKWDLGTKMSYYPLSAEIASQITTENREP